jgi:ribonuclease J
VEEIGKNMTVIEYENDIVIIDAGFQFPGEEAPGVDYIIPDTTYLAERKQKIRGLIVTHGHLDHIGGIPYILERIGNPPVYCRKLSAALIKKRQDEFPHLPRIDMRIVEKEESVTLGNLRARFFAVTHTIPDAMGVVLETPLGNIVHTGDLKVDHQDGVPLPSEEEIFGAVGEGNNLLLMADSTNVEKPGFSYSERAVHENLRKLIKEARARLIIGTFASLLERIILT